MTSTKAEEFKISYSQTASGEIEVDLMKLEMKANSAGLIDTITNTSVTND